MGNKKSQVQLLCWSNSFCLLVEGDFVQASYFYLFFWFFGELDYSPDLDGISQGKYHEGDLALRVVDEFGMRPLKAYHHEYYHQDDDIHHMRDPLEEELHPFSIALDDPT